MNFSITPWSIFLLFGAFQAILLSAFFFFSKKGKKSGNAIYVMGALMSLMSVILFDHSLRLSDLYKSFPNGIYISDALWYLIGPLIWFYVEFRVGKKGFRFWDLAHFIPFFWFAYLYRGLPFADAELKVRILESYLSNDSTHPIIIKVFILIMMIQMLGYFIACWWRLDQIEGLYRQNHSGNEISEVVMLRRLILGFGLYFLFEFTFSTFRNFNNIQNKFLENWSLVVWTIFLITLSYVVALQSGAVSNIIRFSNEKYGGVDFDSIKKKLLTFMCDEAPFVNSDLTLSKLAESIGVKPHLLSYTLNTIMGTTFYDFVNSYRVNHVADQLNRGEHEKLSIIGIAQNAGFKSKASFYSFFKKEFGCNPKEYIDKK